MIPRKFILHKNILYAIYITVFTYLISQGPILSPDSYSYLSAASERNPGYVIFLKLFEFLFPNSYGLPIATQLLIGLMAVDLFQKCMSQLFNLNRVLNGVMIFLLIFPFFPPLLFANNVCSEGLSYPLYLMFLVYGFKYLRDSKSTNLLLFFFFYILLVLTRGQFLMTSTIFLVAFCIKSYKDGLNRRSIIKFISIAALPLAVIFADKLYHKLKDGLFISTPYAYVNMSALAFYVSNKNDTMSFLDTEYKLLFEDCYNNLKEKKLLLNSERRKSIKEDYEFFYNHIPQICNRTIHKITTQYYFDKYMKDSHNNKAASAYSKWQSEIACKNMYFKLVDQNSSQYIKLYLYNLSNAFFSVVILILFVLIFIYSTFGLLLKRNLYFSMLFICSGLVLSNAMIVSIASHSIVRYLFYNYVLIGFTIFLIIKPRIDAKRT